MPFKQANVARTVFQVLVIALLITGNGYAQDSYV